MKNRDEQDAPARRARRHDAAAHPARRRARESHADRLARGGHRAARIHRRAGAGRFPARDTRANSSTGRRSFTPGNCAAFIRRSSSTKNTASRRANSSPTRRQLLDEIIAKKLLTARAVYGFFPANAVGDDVELYTDETRTEVAHDVPFPPPADRQKGGEPDQSLRRFHRAEVDRIARSHRRLRRHDRPRAPKRSWRNSKPITTTTTRSWPRRSPTGWPRPSPNACTSACATSGALGEAEKLTHDEMIAEKYRGIRPAAGYPACPDHTEKAHALGAARCGEKRRHPAHRDLSPCGPARSVSGLYFAHPQSRYFGLGKIDRDQVLDYHLRKGMTAAGGRALARPEPELRSRNDE